MCICIIGLRVRDMLTKEVFGTVHDRQVAATQTPVRTYASVAAQVEEVRECEGEPTDMIDIDPLGSPKSGKKPQSLQGGTPTS